jgi:hypothetical protein
MNTKLNFKQIITAGAMAAGVSVIINSILFFVLKAAGIFTDDIFIQPNQPLTILPIILSSVMPSLVGASIFFLFEKYSNNGFKIFSIVSIVLMVLSFVNPFIGIPSVTIAYGVALDLMHVVVALSLLYFIKKAKN